MRKAGRSFINPSFSVRSFVASLMMIAVFAACSYKTPPVITPAPNEQNLEKSLFRYSDNTAKTFVCGWAPLSEVGFIANWVTVHKAPLMPACNVQFTIEQNNLVGKQVNPSVRDPKDWATVITIPISSHYNLTARRDRFQRPTAEIIQETDRDDYRARSHMTLNLQGLRIHDWAYEILWGPVETHSVHDVEITQHNGKTFVGFTLAVSSTIFGRHLQGQFRFNFLEFNSENPRAANAFQPRLYHDDNSKHFGALWGMGRNIDGVNPLQYVARWDMRPQALPHEFCLHGFENAPEAKQIAIDSINEFNEVFARNGITPPGKQAFAISSRQYRHGFDLRCNTITYVDDRRISERSPLGIAYVQADVNNGKILWGGTTVYGGALSQYIEAYRSGAMLAGNVQDAVYSQRLGRMVVGSMPILDQPRNIQSATLPNGMFGTDFFGTEKRNELLQGALGNTNQGVVRFGEEIARSGLMGQNLTQVLGNSELASQAEALSRRDARSLGRRPPPVGPAETNAQELEYLSSVVRNLLVQAQGLTTMNPQARIEGFSSIEQSVASALAPSRVISFNITGRTAEEFRQNLLSVYAQGGQWVELLLGEQIAGEDAVANEAIFGPGWRTMNVQEKARVLEGQRAGAFARLYKSNMMDLDHTIENFVSMMSAAPESVKNLTTEEIVNVSFKKTLLHELGHVVGLAHNFKENIMPEEGSVPHKHYEELNVAKGKEFHHNAHTIMGYPHPYNTMTKTMDEVSLGKQDELVLRYIYKNEFSVYKPGDEDFSYVRVPRNGRIPREGDDLNEFLPNAMKNAGYKVAYFPNCTDYMAWFGDDPYCNRWDRGFDATTIMQGYLDDYEKNWVPRFNNLADSGTSPFWASYSLWQRSLTTFGRVRIFYDYMRAKYRDEIRAIGNNGLDSDNYYDFSKCLSDGSGKRINDPAGTVRANLSGVARQTNPRVIEILSKPENAELVDLCEANRKVVEKLASFMAVDGPDFTTYDNDNRSMPVYDIGNDYYQSTNRVFGTWKKLGLLPMKLSALYTLTTTMPYRSYGWYVIPTYIYARPGDNTKFTYASLYPMEFTSGIATGVSENIRLNAFTGESPKMNRTALFTGIYLYRTFNDFFDATNDFHHGFSQEYLNSIMNKARFIVGGNTGVFPILLQPVKSREPGEDPTRIKSFTALVYEWGGRNVELGEAFMLPRGRVLMNPMAQTFIYPVSDVLWLSDDLALVWGIRAQYEIDQYTNLGPAGLTTRLHQTYTEVINECLDKANFREYFSKSNRNFKGYKVVPGIAGNEARIKEFNDSVIEEFASYRNSLPENERMVKADKCLKAQDDVGLVITQALATAGYWLPQIISFTGR